MGAHAAFITNGGFEAGLAGWEILNQVGSEGTFFLQTGTASPVLGDPVPPPPAGNAAMSDAAGPGSHVLSQVFTVPVAVPFAGLVFDLFVGNRSTDGFRTPNTLDFATPTLNQQARVDILAGSADAFSMAVADILLNAYRTNVGNPLVSGYNHVFVDITAVVNSHLNVPLRLRFAEVDNVAPFQLGIDNADIVLVSPIPEPSSWICAAGALTLLGVVRRRSRT
jgi:hypothetical protein